MKEFKNYIDLYINHNNKKSIHIFQNYLIKLIGIFSNKYNLNKKK